MMETETRKFEIGVQTKLWSFAVDALRLTTSPGRLVSDGGFSRDRVITLEEVSWHDNSTDCWVVIYDRVYDLTDFFDEHPGGSDVLIEYAGRDASVAFRGTGHSKAAVRALDKFQIGELPMSERIFRKPGGIKLSDMPD